MNRFQKFWAFFGVYVYTKDLAVELRNKKAVNDRVLNHLEVANAAVDRHRASESANYMEAANLRQEQANLLLDYGNLNEDLIRVTGELQAEKRSNSALRGQLTKLKPKKK